MRLHAKRGSDPFANPEPPPPAAAPLPDAALDAGDPYASIVITPSAPAAAEPVAPPPAPEAPLTPPPAAPVPPPAPPAAHLPAIALDATPEPLTPASVEMPISAPPPPPPPPPKVSAPPVIRAAPIKASLPAPPPAAPPAPAADSFPPLSPGRPSSPTEGGRSLPLIGQRYEVLREIGRGGMGVVYLARDIKLMRYVAIKRLTSKSANTKVVQRRFLREAQTIASLGHIHIVSVYDISQDDIGYYITMEYVPGPSLDAGGHGDPPSPVNLDIYVKAKGPMPPGDAKTLIVSVCQALEYAHQRGIIHRDIKPSNILLNPACEPKLVDFGLARPIDVNKGDEITLEGTILGTPEYSAPEQWGDVKAVGVPADIYALAGVLWFALSGRVPRYFREAEVPPNLRVPLAKALAQKPQDRYASMKEFADALTQADAPPALPPQPTVVPMMAGNTVNAFAQPSQTLPPGTMLVSASGVGVGMSLGGGTRSIRTWACPSCNKPNVEGTSYCAFCGASSSLDCSVCGKPMRVGTAFCPHCGADVKHAEEVAGRLLTARNQASFFEFEAAIETIRELTVQNNSEAQKLAKEWRQQVLKRRNLLMDLDSALRVFNHDKAVGLAVELRAMIPTECLSESADFEVVVKGNALIADLRQLLVEAGHRAEEECNLEKYEQNIDCLNKVFGKEACGAINDQLATVRTTLEKLLTQAGLALGWNCYSRALELLTSVQPWRGGELGERRLRVYNTTKEMLEQRDRMIDQIEQALREERFCDALERTKEMGKFRLPPNNSEMEPAKEDMEAHQRIVNIDKILTQAIEDRIGPWIAKNDFTDITQALSILRTGDSAAWKRLADTIRAATNKEIVARYNAALELERMSRMHDADRAWAHLVSIPVELVPTNLWQHASEFPARSQAYEIKSQQKLVQRLLLGMWALWVAFIIMLVTELVFRGFGVLKPLGALGLLLLQFGAYVAGFLLLRRVPKRRVSPHPDDARYPGLAYLAACSPLAFLIGKGLESWAGDRVHPGLYTLAMVPLWMGLDWLRRGHHPWRLPEGLALTIAWVVAIPFFFFGSHMFGVPVPPATERAALVAAYDSAPVTMDAAADGTEATSQPQHDSPERAWWPGGLATWTLASLVQTLAFLLVLGIHWFMHRQQRVRPKEPPAGAPPAPAI